MPRTARLYFAFMTLGAAALLAWWSSQWGAWTAPSPTLIATLFLLAVAAQHFPFEVAPGYKVTASSAAYFAALLALGPPAALALVATAQLIGGLGLFLRRDPATGRRRRGPSGIVFNAAQFVLAFGLGGLVTAAVLPVPATTLDIWLVLWGFLAAAVIHLVNTGAVATMAGLQRRRSILATWLAGQRAEIPEAAALATLGLAMALLARAGGLAPALLAPPLALLHWALTHARHLRDEASRAAAELRAILEAIEQGVLLTDGEGRVRYANRQIGALLGVDAARLPGRQWTDIVTAEIAPRLNGTHSHPPFTRIALPADPAMRGEIGIGNGDLRTLAYYHGPVRDQAGAASGRVEVYEDVTAARRLARARQEFLMVASHELKTPLTTLGGYLDLLARQLNRPAPPDQARLAQYVVIAQEELDRLRRLSEDLIAAAQLRTGHLTVTRRALDLTDLVRTTVERFVAPRNVASRGHEITCRGDGPLAGEYDAARLEQVITNLLGNALKYSPHGGEVVVTIERAGDEARISVRDHGIGIADGEREKLFQPFYRAENADLGSPEGLGLGLAICRDIVEAHDGHLWAETAPGGGSIFRVALPLGIRRRPAGQQPLDQGRQQPVVAADGAASHPPAG